MDQLTEINLLWPIILIIEGVILYFGQRRLFFELYTHSKLAAYVLAAPGTILHELSHWLMCKLLGVRTGKVTLFRPRREGDSITLGQVEHASADPLRLTLVSIAPLLLVPAFLVGIGVLLYGTELLQHPWDAIWGSAWYLKLAGLYLLLSTSSAAFPSPGDHIPVVGMILLLGVVALIVISVSAQTIDSWLRLAAIVTAPTAAATLIQLSFWSRRRL